MCLNRSQHAHYYFLAVFSLRCLRDPTGRLLGRKYMVQMYPQSCIFRTCRNAVARIVSAVAALVLRNSSRPYETAML